MNASLLHPSCNLTSRSASCTRVPKPPRQRVCQARLQHNEARELVAGIDLGTTNSVIAYIEAGKPKCIPNDQGDLTTPSVVAILPEGEVLVGKKAKRQAALNPENTYYSVKRLIGREYEDEAAQQEIPRLAYKVIKDEEGALALQCTNVPEGLMYPEQVSANVLGHLLEDAERYTGARVTKAVISVPAYFDDAQREATIDAGRLAGLDTIRIIREPVAAALAYGLDLQADQTVLVFDLGGGTYDISILEVGNGTVEVLATGGDAQLGGDDWDEAVVQWLQREHLQKAGIDCRQPRIRANLKALAEYAKVTLSSSEQVVLRMPIGGPDGGPLEVVLTRGRFDELTSELYRRCRLPLDQAAWQAGVELQELLMELEGKRAELQRRGVPQWKQQMLQVQIRPKQRNPLTKILLVGGATRMPAVRSFIRNMTGLEPEVDSVNPDEAVALGAAVQAGILQGEVSDMLVMDVWQASLMRAMAQLQLRQSEAAKQQVQQQFDMSELEADGEDEKVKEVPKRQKRRDRRRQQQQQQAAAAAQQQVRVLEEEQQEEGAS